jgi:hypothetical protein
VASRQKTSPELVVPPQPFRCVAPQDYAGDVYVWDLDKTYLRTEFHGLRDLIRTALQKAKDKVAYPGASPLLRALRNAPDGSTRPIYFVSASPPQLRDVILEKFELDGVEVDGIYFKDNLRNIRPGRLRRLREQMGYKLLALLHLRKQLPAGAVEVMFGDDFETDVAIYSLYSEILEHWIRGPALKNLLLKQGVFRDEALKIAWRARSIAQRTPVSRIYLRCHRELDPRYYRRFGDTVVATRNYFQTALALYGEDRIIPDAVVAVGQELLGHSGLNRYDLAADLEDLLGRGAVTREKMAPVAEDLVREKVLPAGVV